MFAIDFKRSTANISILFPVPPPKLQHWRRQIDSEETECERKERATKEAMLCFGTVAT